MAITKPTAGQVINEASLKIEYFPRFTDDFLWETWIGTKITEIDAQVQLHVGAYADSADARIQLTLTRAEIYLTCGYLWQQIKNVIDAWDDEVLPPEWANSDQAAANRDWYLAQGNELLGRYDGDTVQTPNEYVGAVMTASAGDTDTGPLGQSY
jgi:hypothetical protein